ncbi:hypothetical protein BT96DRAFT_990223 [Gymnopus androsaceus JB14]|uniref:F-box domain-containing protein n=1 Tax=Gymnopus androsaceus JB14 TaxID=1447944 RepID=A0A6A4I459_9AGAR|nr:hypothetical protein BT96DRAFT_990223 [Gymnopus androsaceus JB14]
MSTSQSEAYSEAYEKYQEVLARTRSNDFPKSSAERSQLHALIEQTQHDLKSCTNATARILLEKALEFQESLFAPIRTLPAEIMYVIFKLIRDGNSGFIELTTDDYDGEFQCRGWIFQLTGICSHWREIILSSSSFWNHFELRGRVDVYSSKASGFGYMEACLKELLLRSGTTAPISLGVFFRGHSLKDSSGLFPTLDALSEQASRWREAKLCFIWSKHHLAHMLERVCSQITTFPALEVLEILSDHQTFEPGFYGTTFSHCPRLYTLTMSSYRLSDLFDLRNLTTLKIHTYVGHSFAALLQKCPLLETFELKRSISDSQSLEVPTILSISSPILHSSLTRLEILDINDRSPTGFWQHVSLPKLTRVRALMIGIERNRNRFDEFKTMLIDSQCILQRVDFIWYKNALNESLESLVQGIRISPQSHTHFVSESDNTHRKFNAVNGKPCQYCVGSETE